MEKLTVILIIFLCVFIAVEIRNKLAVKELKQHVVAFMAEGGRNTNVDGYKLCLRLNALEEINNIKPSNCKQFYTIK